MMLKHRKWCSTWKKGRKCKGMCQDLVYIQNVEVGEIGRQDIRYAIRLVKMLKTHIFFNHSAV